MSVAITGLSKRKWVHVSNLITANKGRPEKIFALNKTIDDILDGIKEEFSAGHDEQMNMLRRIREIIQN